MLDQIFSTKRETASKRTLTEGTEVEEDDDLADDDSGEEDGDPLLLTVKSVYAKKHNGRGEAEDDGERVRLKVDDSVAFGNGKIEVEKPASG